MANVQWIFFSVAQFYVVVVVLHSAETNVLLLMLAACKIYPLFKCMFLVFIVEGEKFEISKLTKGPIRAYIKSFLKSHIILVRSNQTSQHWTNVVNARDGRGKRVNRSPWVLILIRMLPILWLSFQRHFHLCHFL